MLRRSAGPLPPPLGGRGAGGRGPAQGGGPCLARPVPLLRRAAAAGRDAANHGPRPGPCCCCAGQQLRAAPPRAAATALPLPLVTLARWLLLPCGAGYAYNMDYASAAQPHGNCLQLRIIEQCYTQN